MRNSMLLLVAAFSGLVGARPALGQVADRPASATVAEAHVSGDGIGPYVDRRDNLSVVLRSAPDRENLHLNIGPVKRGMVNRYLCVALTAPVDGPPGGETVCGDMYLFTYDAPQVPFRLTDMGFGETATKSKSMSIRWTSGRTTNTLAFGFKDGQLAGDMVTITRLDDVSWRVELPELGRARLFRFDSVKTGEQVVGDYFVPVSIVFTLK